MFSYTINPFQILLSQNHTSIFLSFRPIAQYSFYFLLSVEPIFSLFLFTAYFPPDYSPESHSLSIAYITETQSLLYVYSSYLHTHILTFPNTLRF